MNKTFLIYILSVIPLIGYGQFDVNKAFEALKQAEKGNSIVETTVVPDLSIVRQQYRLERNGEYFGRNHNPHYGETYSLAVKVSGGTLFLQDVVEPWKRDADYARDNASGKYSPSLYWTYQRPLDGGEYKSVNFEITEDNGYVKPLNQGKSLYIHSDVVGDFGLSIDNVPGEKQGFMLWAYSPTNVPDSAMTVDILQSPFTVVASADSSLVKMTPNAPERIIGGIFVTPKYERGGRVQFILSGVAVRDDSDGWCLQLLCAGNKDTVAIEESVITPSAGGNFAPGDVGDRSNPQKKKKK